jgi:hypothetical protein
LSHYSLDNTGSVLGKEAESPSSICKHLFTNMWLVCRNERGWTRPSMTTSFSAPVWQGTLSEPDRRFWILECGILCVAWWLSLVVSTPGCFRKIMRSHKHNPNSTLQLPPCRQRLQHRRQHSRGDFRVSARHNRADGAHVLCDSSGMWKLGHGGRLPHIPSP